MTPKDTVVVSARVAPGVQRALDSRAEELGCKRQDLVARGVHLVLEEPIINQEQQVLETGDVLGDWGL